LVRSAGILTNFRADFKKNLGIYKQDFRSGGYFHSDDNLLNMPPTLNPTAMQLADLQILTEVRSIADRSGRTVPLRRKEFQLLKFLVNNPDCVISKFALLDLIWEFGSFAGSNTLDVHLSGLRKKLKGLTGRVSIETVRGVGYRLITTI
jgi:two-component system alkaline phosphatase synthesis response regulator PhoP